MIPFVALLMLLPLLASGNYIPVPSIYQGHKARIPIRYTERSGSDNGECSDKITQWRSWGWSNGLDGKIRIKAKGSPAVDGWTITLRFDRDVQSCVVYDTDMTNSSSRDFVATARDWNKAIPEDQEKVLDLQVTWASGTQEPRLERINIDGQGYQCIMGGPTTTNSPTTQSSSSPDPSQSTDPSSSTVVPQTSTDVAPTTTTTTHAPPMTTASGERRGIFAKWPKKVVGLYVLLADDDHEGFESDRDWEPELYEYQQKGANVLFFTFIHPTTMAIPPAFQHLAKTRGTGEKGAIPKDTVILFAIGGYAYSVKINPWHWLKSKAAAEEMAAEVAQWPKKYNCDGIDLDIEDGAGDAAGAGENMVHFVRKLRELSPNMIISQPTYGYPAIDAEIDLINESWDANGNYYNLADSIGLMVYEGTNALNYVKNYNDGAGRWEGFPMTCRAPNNTIILGAKGQAGDSTINALVDSVIKHDYLGIMVWYVSVPNGLQYAVSWDGSDQNYQQSFVNAMEKLKPYQ